MRSFLITAVRASFIGFAVFEKVLIEIPQDRFETEADDSDHVEGVSDFAATSVGSFFDLAFLRYRS